MGRKSREKQERRERIISELSSQNQALAEELQTRRVETGNYRWEVGGLLLGTGLTLMVTEIWPQVYWLGVGFTYIGSLLLLYHLCRDAEFRKKHSVFYLIAIAAVSAFVSIWSCKVVFIKAPLNHHAYADLGNYPPGTVIGGFAWKDPDRYVDVRMFVWILATLRITTIAIWMSFLAQISR